jgi:hypothetical protein
VITPMMHANWTKVLPTTQRKEGWAIRSMMRIGKDLEMEQIPVESADETAALLHLPGRVILVASIYVPGIEAGALRESIRLIHHLVTQAKAKVNCQ